MSDVLHDFYLSALGAELQFAPATAFSARMATHYCRMVMALESAADAEQREVTATGGEVSPGKNKK